MNALQLGERHLMCFIWSLLVRQYIFREWMRLMHLGIIWFALPSAGAFELWHQGPDRLIKAFCEGNWSQAVAVTCRYQIISAVLPQYIYCDNVQNRCGFPASPWQHMSISSMFMYDLLTPCILLHMHFPDRGITEGPSGILQQKGSLNSHFPNPQAVSQIREYLLGVFVFLHSYTAHTPHHIMLFSVPITYLMVFKHEHSAAAKEAILFGCAIRTYQCWRWMSLSRQCIWVELRLKANVWYSLL